MSGPGGGGGGSEAQGDDRVVRRDHFRRSSSHETGYRLAALCSDSLQRSDHARAILIGAGLAQLGLRLDPARHDLEADDCALESADTILAEPRDVPRRLLRCLVLLDLAIERPQPLGVGDRFGHSVDVHSHVVPRWHEPLHRVPLPETHMHAGPRRWRSRLGQPRSRGQAGKARSARLSSDSG